MDDASKAKLAPFSETIDLLSGAQTTVGVALANGRKCARCWNYSEAVPETAVEPLQPLCERCGPVVDLLGFKPSPSAGKPALATA